MLSSWFHFWRKHSELRSHVNVIVKGLEKLFSQFHEFSLVCFTFLDTYTFTSATLLKTPKEFFQTFPILLLSEQAAAISLQSHACGHEAHLHRPLA